VIAVILELLTVLLGSTIGGLIGSAIGSRCHANPSWDEPSKETVEEFPEDHARRAAQEWTDANDLPEFEDVIVNKLRLGWGLQQRRSRPRGETR
jgi:hypothetical protein